MATAGLLLAMATCYLGLSVVLVWLLAADDARMAGPIDLHDLGVDRWSEAGHMLKHMVRPTRFLAESATSTSERADVWSCYHTSRVSAWCSPVGPRLESAM